MLLNCLFNMGLFCFLATSVIVEPERGREKGNWPMGYVPLVFPFELVYLLVLGTVTTLGTFLVVNLGLGFSTLLSFLFFVFSSQLSRYKQFLHFILCIGTSGNGGLAGSDGIRCI